MEDQDAAQQIQDSHEAIVAVFQTERDAKGYIKVKLPDGNKGKLFMPDADRPDGLRQMAEAVL